MAVGASKPSWLYGRLCTDVPLHLLNTGIRDARYALRMMRRTPAFTAAILTLAMAIGVNTAVFSIGRSGDIGLQSLVASR